MNPVRKTTSVDVNIIALPLPGLALCALLSAASNCFNAHYVGYGQQMQRRAPTLEACSERRPVSLIAPQGRPPILEAALQLMVAEHEEYNKDHKNPAKHAVLLTSPPCTAEISRALQAGIGVFLDEAEEPDQFYAAIYAAVRGAYYTSPGLAEFVYSPSYAGNSLCSKPSNGAPKLDVDRAPLTSLTPRERQVAILIAQGYSDAEAAQELFVSPKTVNSHLKAVYQKLNIRRRTQLAQYVR